MLKKARGKRQKAKGARNPEFYWTIKKYHTGLHLKYKRAYSVFHSYEVHRMVSRFPIPSSLFPLPCSLSRQLNLILYDYLYFTQFSSKK
ncbi:MAG: hypothetical protein F6J98_05445 [Moorea sp. SIO4G2]|nr:hypothetical protein [Moorena sp. SIO4G2]